MKQRESTFQEFWRTTYRSGSPVPYMVSILVAVFVLIHLFDLLVDMKVTGYPMYDRTVALLSLPASFPNFVSQPWALLTYPFLYTSLFRLVFDCLWIYWTGNIFLNLLHSRQFLTLFFGGLFVGGIFYLGVGQIPPMLQNSPQTLLNTAAFGIVALLVALINLVPRTEVRLFLFGRVQFQILAIIYLVLQFGFYAMVNYVAAVAYVGAGAWGWFFMDSLKNGRDFSNIFKKKLKKELRIIRTQKQTTVPNYKSYRADLPNQDEVDAILDKISLNGYESLTAEEKEALFRVSDEAKDKK